ncbi:MAG: LysR family transcriptional regulator [Lachnospiraceae bacterium]|nr:LysR family transcriptional regulator [Lachnospiraceae bacterium]
MEVRVLRYFLAVAREESITGAAESLHITQPTLSKQLMEMEQELGTTLFLRGKRKITLTEDGIFLRKRAQEIVDLVDKTENEFSDKDEDVISGDVYIGGGETEAMRLIARTIQKMSGEYPQIRYHLFSGNADDVMERMDKGLLDFGIVIEPADIKKYDYIKIPATDAWGLLMSKENPLSAKAVIKPSDMLGIPLMMSRQSMAQNDLSGWLGSNVEKLNIVGTYNLIYNAALMVEEGFGSALCLDKLVDLSGNRNLVFRPFAPKLESNLDLVWKKYQVFSKASQKFLEYLQEEFSQMV